MLDKYVFFIFSRKLMIIKLFDQTQTSVCYLNYSGVYRHTLPIIFRFWCVLYSGKKTKKNIFGTFRQLILILNIYKRFRREFNLFHRLSAVNGSSLASGYFFLHSTCDKFINLIKNKNMLLIQPFGNNKYSFFFLVSK